MSYILVVDDSESHQRLLVDILGIQNYEVIPVSNGEEALEKAAERPPQLILLDINMPGLNGFETIRRLKKNEALRHIPVLFLTGQINTQSMVKAFEMGGVDYVTKPFSSNELLARVNTHITLHQLQDDLTRKNRELDEANRFIRQIFGRYVSEEVVSELLNKPEGLNMGGELREVTILMSDLRRFTSISEKLSPNQVVELINGFLEIMVDVILHYGGTVDDIMGDAIMVIFGSPVSCSDHAERAVACGIEMQQAMERVNASNRISNLPEIEMGIGIHTGTVVAGNLGSSKRTKYSVLGSPVNLASRIESFAAGGQVLLSETTRLQISVPLRVDGENRIQPKGAEKAINICQVGGIDGNYQLYLPFQKNEFTRINPPHRILFSPLNGKTVSSENFTGHIIALSVKRALIEVEEPIPYFPEFHVRLDPESDSPNDNVLYGNVMTKEFDQTRGINLRFTSLTPDAKETIKIIIAKNSAVSGE